MRIDEILYEHDVKDEITNDLMDIIATFKQKKVLNIPINGDNGLINYLRKLGFDVSANELTALMAKPPFDGVVERTTPESVIVKSDSPQSNMSHQQKDKAKDHVQKAATNVAKKSINTPAGPKPSLTNPAASPAGPKPSTLGTK